MRSPLKLEPFHDGFFGSFLTQIKLKLSPLRAQLFRYNLIDNPFCPPCGSAPETPMHFFLECQNYRRISPKFLSYSFKIDDTLNFKDNNVILDLIINGSHHSSIVKRSSLNKAIFRHVKIFIAMTERFQNLIFIVSVFINNFSLICIVFSKYPLVLFYSFTLLTKLIVSVLSGHNFHSLFAVLSNNHLM